VPEAAGGVTAEVGGSCAEIVGGDGGDWGEAEAQAWEQQSSGLLKAGLRLSVPA
jgi:hypothetical protein